VESLFVKEITKINFNLENARADLQTLHPAIKIFETSCITGAGLDDFCNRILEKLDEVN